jgi:hypothetical protein
MESLLTKKPSKRAIFADITRKPYTAILRDKRRNGAGSGIAEWLAVLQGGYYFLMGLWPLVAMRWFLAVAGPKTDIFLVQTVAALVLVIGVVFVVAGVRSVLSLELGLLMVGCSFGLGLIDTVYVIKGVIPPIYLADACEEICVLLLTLTFLHRFSHRRHSSFL